MDNNKIIGPNSIINFDFNQKEINSKIDTGAETNSLHSNNFFINSIVWIFNYGNFLGDGKTMMFKSFFVF